MQKWIIYASIVVCFLLILFIGGGQYWLKRNTNKEISTGANNITCEYDSKTYQLGEVFFIQLSTDCGLCFCGKDELPICEKIDCSKKISNE